MTVRSLFLSAASLALSVNAASAQASPTILSCPSKQCSPTPIHCTGDKCSTYKAFCWCSTPYQATNNCVETEQKCCDDMIPLVSISSPCSYSAAQLLYKEGVVGTLYMASCRGGFVPVHERTTEGL